MTTLIRQRVSQIGHMNAFKPSRNRHKLYFVCIREPIYCDVTVGSCHGFVNGNCELNRRRF